MKRLLKYAKPYWHLLVLTTILMMLVTALELVRPYLIKITIDNYYLISPEDSNSFRSLQLSKRDYQNFRKYNMDGLTKIGIIFLAAIIVAFLFNYLQVYILNYTSQMIIFNIRQDIFSHIQSLSIAYFDKNSVGRLVTRVINDTENLNEMYAEVLVNLFKDIFILGGIIIIMLKMDFKLAFVRATGAGKSSIINLITRFYDIQKGEILINGVNIKDYDKYELRKHIGVVLQDVFLFTGTIKDNIRLNNKNIKDEEIVEMAKHVNAHHFINKLPHQYEEPVMERGSTLSALEREGIYYDLYRLQFKEDFFA